MAKKRTVKRRKKAAPRSVGLTVTETRESSDAAARRLAEDEE